VKVKLLRDLNERIEKMYSVSGTKEIVWVASATSDTTGLVVIFVYIKGFGFQSTTGVEAKAEGIRG